MYEQTESKMSNDLSGLCKLGKYSLARTTICLIFSLVILIEWCF